MSKRVLYSRFVPVVTLILLLTVVAAPWSAGQGRPQLKRPNDVPEEKPPEPKKKKVKGPRAVGIVQFNSGGKSTLIPVAILIDGKFYDASVYKADPVPMALESGTVYEAEETGESQGLFTVNGALHSKNPGNQNPWVGAGSFLAQGADAPKSTRKAEDEPVGLDTSGDGPPRLTRGKGSKTETNPDSGSSDAAPGKAGTTLPSAASGQTTGGSSSNGTSGRDAAKPATGPTPDKTADADAKPQVAGAQKSSDQKSADQKPAEQKSTSQAGSSQTSSGQASSSPAGGENTTGPAAANQSGADYYRPTLRRGKPTQGAPAEENTPAKVEGPRPPVAGNSAASTEAVRVEPAISDAGGPEPQSYKYFWKEGEEDERRKQMLELAANEVQAYLTARAKGAIPAKPAAKNGAANHKSVAKLTPPVFENIQFRGFDVWKNGQLVMVLSAEAHLPSPGMTAAPENYSITLVTRTDIYGNLRKLYCGITDKFHLDVTPRLELIDVVDADGDGRGELLFRETSDAGKGYLIYRATADTLWKMFDSLGE